MLATCLELLLVASITSPTADEPLTFTFDNARWSDVLDWVAKPLGLTVRMELEPAGRFSYRDDRRFRAQEAYDFVHGALLDRGVTLVRQGRLVFPALIAEALPGELAPFVPSEHLADRASNDLVTTTFRLHHLPAPEAAVMLESVLTARGTLRGTTLTDRLIARDHVVALLQLKAILLEVDPPEGVAGAHLRVFEPKNIGAEHAAFVLEELFVDESAGTPSTSGDDQRRGKRRGSRRSGREESSSGGVPDFSQMGQQLVNRNVLESFVPGISLRGIAPEGASVAPPTRVAVHPSRNALYVSGAPAVLHRAGLVVAAMDVARTNDGPTTVLRNYEAPMGNAEVWAARLNGIHGVDREFLAAGAGNVLMVQASEERQRQVARCVEQWRAAATAVAVFTLHSRSAENVAQQFSALFKTDETGGPRFISDPTANRLVVRGDAAVIAETRRLLMELGEAVDIPTSRDPAAVRRAPPARSH